MDPFIRRELVRLDPEVPFRATTAHRHQTWARTYHSRPELYIQPETTEEIQKIITLARRCRRRLVVVGSCHSPSDLTCTSSWMVNLDNYSRVISVNSRTKIAVVQAGLRLRDLTPILRDQGLAMPNLGSINEQSIAGALTTGTHGSSIKHGILARSVLALKIMLSNGRVVSCSAEQNVDLFRAALVSLGALGIIIEVTFKAAPQFNISWKQDLVPLDNILSTWSDGLWDTSEFTRVWWFPYMKKCVKWQANKTHDPPRAAKASWFSGRAGYHIYHGLLYIAQYIPRLLPAIEWFVINVQYGGDAVSAVEEGSQGLLMNCLYSQFVNEWAIPLDKGPEAIARLSTWLHGDRAASGIPFDPAGIYVHAPIEVRIANDIGGDVRAFLDNTMSSRPSLLLNATLYRPYDLDPPAHLRYYEAFEWLMKQLGGRPHWAKNFHSVSAAEIRDMYPELPEWLRVREDVDPEGMFLGEWHRRLFFTDEEAAALPLAEKEARRELNSKGGFDWYGIPPGRSLSPQNSEESFDLMHGAEAEKSIVLERDE